MLRSTNTVKDHETQGIFWSQIWLVSVKIQSFATSNKLLRVEELVTHLDGTKQPTVVIAHHHHLVLLQRAAKGGKFLLGEPALSPNCWHMELEMSRTMTKLRWGRPCFLVPSPLNRPRVPHPT